MISTSMPGRHSSERKQARTGGFSWSTQRLVVVDALEHQPGLGPDVAHWVRRHAADVNRVTVNDNTTYAGPPIGRLDDLVTHDSHGRLLSWGALSDGYRREHRRMLLKPHR